MYINFKKNAIFLLILFFCFKSYAQETKTVVNTIPSVAISSNLLYDVTTSMNLGVELKLSTASTLKFPVTYNPWTLENNKKFKFIHFQPEWRWWLCEAFTGHFFGLQAHYAYFNVGGMDKFLGIIPFPKTMQEHRFEGHMIGVGLAYGYQFYLAPRWSLELSLGIGYAFLDYDTYNCEECGKLISHDTDHYFGPTQAGISLIYFLK
jgi:hypothetical protein